MLFFWTPLFLYLALQANKSQFKVVNRPAASQPEPTYTAQPFFSLEKIQIARNFRPHQLVNHGDCSILYFLSLSLPAMKKDGPENCEKWASCCLKAIKYTSAKCHLSLSKQSQGHKLSDICRQKYIYFPAPPKNSSLPALFFSLSKKKKICHRFHFWLQYNQNICHEREDLNQIQNHSISVDLNSIFIVHRRQFGF